MSCRTRARPRVESFSSRVARKLGHITPPLVVRQRPTPMQPCTAWMKGSSPVCSVECPSGALECHGRFGTSASARSVVMGAGSTMLPGLRTPEGSQIRRKSAKARSISAEYISGSRADRARPSPCSPDSEPP
ncbi:Uncharacterised protein [Mycobacteroides abscessus subsp. abscessus]|nr:Uncharacterised protein [Mycobacteroides abscessus subsp. abscessus]